MANIEERNGKYRVLIRVKGFPAISKTFERKTDAKIWAQQTESEMRQGSFIKTSESRKHTLNEAIERYIQHVLPEKAKNARNVYQHLQWWRKTMGHLLLSDVTSARVAQARDQLGSEVTQLGKKRSPSTIVRYLASLSIVLSLACREWQWVNENVLHKVTKPKEPRGRVRFLDDDELERFLKACKESSNHLLYPYVVLSISTGMRRGEVLNLTWKDVDFKTGRIILHQTKNDERRSVPLTGLAFSLLKGLAGEKKLETDSRGTDKTDKTSLLVFPSLVTSKPIDLRFPWEQALRAAKITNFRPHDMRHCTASFLAMTGASLAEIAEVLGHKSLSMVKRYMHLSENHTSKVVSRMNEKYLGEHDES
jgi:integrase